MGWYKRAVMKGVELLDIRKNGWWRRGIKNAILLESINMSSARDCLLGQCYGSARAGRIALNLQNSFPSHPWQSASDWRDYGFEVYARWWMPDFIVRRRRIRLAKLWRQLIQTRRRQAEQSAA